MDTERSNSTLDTPPTSSADSMLPEDLAICHAMIRELIDALKKEQHEREGIQQRLDLLLRKLYGPKAERFNPD
jgi:transposase